MDEIVPMIVLFPVRMMEVVVVGNVFAISFSRGFCWAGMISQARVICGWFVRALSCASSLRYGSRPSFPPTRAERGSLWRMSRESFL